MALTSGKRLGWVAVALCAVLLSVASAPAGASTARSGPFCCRSAPPWRGVAGFRLSRTAGFVDVVGLGRDDAWAVGDTGVATTGGIAAHWNGKAWRQVPFPLKHFVPVSVSAREGSNAWVFGYQYDAAVSGEDWRAYALEWAAGKWQLSQLPSAGAAWDVLGDLQSAVLSNDDVWVTGNGLDNLGQPTNNLAWNWNGSDWTSYPLHIAGVGSISASSGSNVWVAGAGSTDRTFALRWNGTRWRRAHVPNLTKASVVADSARSVWLTGSVMRNGVAVGAVAHWNGAHWSAISLIPPVLVGQSPASTDWRGGLWFGRYAHESGGTWYVPTALPSWHGCQFGLGAGTVAAIPGTSAAWFAGACGRGHSTRLIPAIAIDGRL
jgi:hypothetical protein